MTDLPGNVSVCGVKGHFAFARLTPGDPDGVMDLVPVTGLVVTLTPTPKFLLNATSTPPTVIVPEPLVLTTDINGDLRDVDSNTTAYVIASDDPDLNPTGFTYTVSFSGIGADKFTPFSAAFPGGQTIDMTLLTPVSTALGTSVSVAQAAAAAAAASATAAAASAASLSLPSGSNDDVLQRKSGVWTSRTPAQLKTDLALTKSDVALGNVDNTSDANKPVSTAQATAIASAAASGPVSSVAGKTGAVSLVKADVGLGNVDNTSDASKPVSTATATALSGKAATSHTHTIADIQATGTPSSGNYLRGDGSWATPAAGGGSNYLTLATKTGSFTAADDGVDCYEITSDTAVTATLPASVPTGTTKEFLQAGAGQVTLAAGAGATLLPPDVGAVKTAKQWASVFARSRQASLVANPPATNMLLRFKADDLAGSNGAAVSSWAESSGQGHPAAVQATTGNQPTIATNSGGTGHKGVAFNGNNSFLTLSGSALNVARNRSALTIFAAIVFSTAVTTGTRTLFSLSTGTGATSSRVLLGHRDSVSGFPILGGRRLDANSLGSITGTAAVNTAQNTVLSGRIVYSGSDLYLYKDGTQIGTTTSFQTDGTSQDTASLAGVIGANLAGTGEWFFGHLLELLVYDGDDASGSLRQNVHSYYSQTYGITVADALPATTGWVISGGVA